MNYRHAFHAGNFADVVKHTTLALCIEYLKKKPAPFAVLDTHAGAGRYRLDEGAATRTAEWEAGIGRLLGPHASPLPEHVARLMAPYLDVVRAENRNEKLTIYPGSPVIVQALLRKDDRLVANELHPEDGKLLAKAIGDDRSVRVTALDGYTALKANLPPKERRGLVLIDPPFEEPGELIRLTEGLADALKRFATGTVLLWYPVKDQKPVQRFKRKVAEVIGAARLEQPLVVEIFLRPPRNPLLLNGAGLLVVNPPYTLASDMEIALSELAPRLAGGSTGMFSVVPLTKSLAEEKKIT